MLPKAQVSSSITPEEAPRPLNKEALELILEFAKDKAQQGFGGIMFFLDGIFGQYMTLEKPTRYYVESVVLDMLKDPNLGFQIEEEDTGDGTIVKLRWSDDHPEFSYSYLKTIEVTPPEEQVSFLLMMKLKS